MTEIVSLVQEVSDISEEVSLQAFLAFMSSLGICYRLLSETGCLATTARQVGCPRNSLSLTQVQHSASKVTVFHSSFAVPCGVGVFSAEFCLVVARKLDLH